MKIQVLGSGCAKCKDLYQIVQEVVKNLGHDIEVEYFTDIAKIVEIGAMTSPVLVIDGELITAGRLPSSEDIEDFIKAKMR